MSSSALLTSADVPGAMRSTQVTHRFSGRGKKKGARIFASARFDFPCNLLTYLLKFACTERFATIVTEQVNAVPEHDPVQFTNVLPAGGVAVRVTTVPELNFAEQVLPQLMPATSLVTVPVLLRPI